MKLSLQGLKASLAATKLSGFTKTSLAAGGVLFFVWLGLTLFTGGEAKKIAAKVDPSKCPDCGRPLVRESKMGGDCPFCKQEDPTLQKKKARLGGSGGFLESKWIPIGLIATFVVLVVANVVVLVRGRLKKGSEEEDLFHMNCRKCDRRVRYREKQAGVLARCPNCRCLIKFPEVPEKKRGWSVVKGWLSIPGKKKAQQDSA